MKGTYCLLIGLRGNATIDIGALGRLTFPAGTYVYVGSALRGIEDRVARHRSMVKRRRWHIDYLLDRAEVVSTVAIPGGLRSVECEVARTLLESEGAQAPAKGFGSSDCGCRTHLVDFGDADPEWIAETVAMQLSMLQCAYPRRRE